MTIWRITVWLLRVNRRVGRVSWSPWSHWFRIFCVALREDGGNQTANGNEDPDNRQNTGGFKSAKPFVLGSQAAYAENDERHELADACDTRKERPRD